MLYLCLCYALGMEIVTTLHTKSPDQRYSHLLAEHPDWLNRFPQRHIASYLGMTPETLSRVRARIA